MSQPKKKIADGLNMRLARDRRAPGRGPEVVVEGECKYSSPLKMETLSDALRSALKRGDSEDLERLVFLAKNQGNILALLLAHRADYPPEHQELYAVISTTIVELLDDPKKSAQFYMNLGQPTPEIFMKLSTIVPPQQLARHISPSTIMVLHKMSGVDTLYLLEYLFSSKIVSDSPESKAVCRFVLDRIDSMTRIQVGSIQTQLVRTLFKLPNIFNEIYLAVLKKGSNEHLKSILKYLKPIMANWITQCNFMSSSHTPKDILQPILEDLLATLQLPPAPKSMLKRQMQRKGVARQGNDIRVKLSVPTLLDSLKVACQTKNVGDVMELLELVTSNQNIDLLLEFLASSPGSLTSARIMDIVVQAAVDLLSDRAIRASVVDSDLVIRLITTFGHRLELIRLLSRCPNVEYQSAAKLVLPVFRKALSPVQLARRIKPTSMNIAYLRNDGANPIYILEYGLPLSVESWTKALLLLLDYPFKSLTPLQAGLARLLFMQEERFAEIKAIVMEKSIGKQLETFFTFMEEVMQKAESMGLFLNAGQESADIYQNMIASFIQTLEFPELSGELRASVKSANASGSSVWKRRAQNRRKVKAEETSTESNTEEDGNAETKN